MPERLAFQNLTMIGGRRSLSMWRPLATNPFTVMPSPKTLNLTASGLGPGAGQGPLSGWLVESFTLSLGNGNNALRRFLGCVRSVHLKSYKNWSSCASPHAR